MRCFKVQTKFPQANRWIPIFGEIRAQLRIQHKMTVKAAILWTRGSPENVLLNRLAWQSNAASKVFSCKYRSMYSSCERVQLCLSLVAIVEI